MLEGPGARARNGFHAGLPPDVKEARSRSGSGSASCRIIAATQRPSGMGIDKPGYPPRRSMALFGTRSRTKTCREAGPRRTATGPRPTCVLLFSPERRGTAIQGLSARSRLPGPRDRRDPERRSGGSTGRNERKRRGRRVASPPERDRCARRRTRTFRTDSCDRTTPRKTAVAMARGIPAADPRGKPGPGLSLLAAHSRDPQGRPGKKINMNDAADHRRPAGGDLLDLVRHGINAETRAGHLHRRA